MTAFNKEQMATLQAMARAIEVLIRQSSLDVQHRVTRHTSALFRVLEAKGILTAKELTEATRVEDAELAIEGALDPELNAARAELEALIRELGKQQPEK